MKFDDLYLNYDDEELEIEMSLRAVVNDSKVAKEAAKYYQMGKAQDLVYAEQAMTNGASFGVVKNIIHSNIKKRAQARPQFDTALRNALIKAKKLPDKNFKYEAHHIVAKGAARAQRAIAILRALGIDIDDIANGVFLPANERAKREGSLKNASIHKPVHTNAYYANVTFEVVETYTQNAVAGISKAEQRNEMIELLKDIGKQLQNGKYPTHKYLPGAEVYA